MGVFSKLKDVLFDVEEEEIPVITKEEKKEKIEKEENPIKEVKMPKDDFLDDFEMPDDEIEEIPPVKPKKEFSFPLDDFDDDLPQRSKKDFFDEDFTSRSFDKEPVKEKPKKEYDYDYDYSRLDIKNLKKDNTKTFTPSPVISPVYGILDQNYTKDDVIVRNDGMKRKSDKTITLDDVRKKAYGKKEEKEETAEPLKKIDEILIDEEEEVVIPKPKTKKVKEEVIEELKKEEEILEESTLPEVFDDELPDEPYPDEEIEKKDTLDDTLETDLFNLIDSMYEEKNEREEE